MLPDGAALVAFLQRTLDATPGAAETPTPAVIHALDQLLCQYGWEGLNALYEAVEDPYLVHHLRQQALQVAARCSTVAPEGVVQSEVFAVPLRSQLLMEDRQYAISDELRDAMQAMVEPVALDWATDGFSVRVEPVLLNALGASALSPEILRVLAMEALGVRMTDPAFRSPLETLSGNSLTDPDHRFFNGLLLITVVRREGAIAPWEDWVTLDGAGLEPMYDCSIFGEMARECGYLLVDAGVIRSDLDLGRELMPLGEAISACLDGLRERQVEDQALDLVDQGNRAIVTQHGSGHGPVEVRLSVVDRQGRLVSARRIPLAWEGVDHVLAAVTEVVAGCGLDVADPPGGDGLFPLASCPECRYPLFYEVGDDDALSPRCPNSQCIEAVGL